MRAAPSGHDRVARSCLPAFPRIEGLSPAATPQHTAPRPLTKVNLPAPRTTALPFPRSLPVRINPKAWKSPARARWHGSPTRVQHAPAPQTPCASLPTRAQSHLLDSNQRPELYESSALPTELRWQGRPDNERRGGKYRRGGSPSPENRPPYLPQPGSGSPASSPTTCIGRHPAWICSSIRDPIRTRILTRSVSYSRPSTCPRFSSA